MLVRLSSWPIFGLNGSSMDSGTAKTTALQKPIRDITETVSMFYTVYGPDWNISTTIGQIGSFFSDIRRMYPTG